MRAVVLAWMITIAVIMGLHAWQDSMEEDSVMIFSCHTMGNRECDPGQPWIKVYPDRIMR